MLVTEEFKGNPEDEEEKYSFVIESEDPAKPHIGVKLRNYVVQMLQILKKHFELFFYSEWEKTITIAMAKKIEKLAEFKFKKVLNTNKYYLRSSKLEGKLFNH